MKHFCAFIIAVTIFYMPLDLRAASGPIFPFPVFEDALENGFKVVSIPFDSPGVVAYLTVVRVGARDEVEPGCTGFAHFFEHMMFKGTENFSGADREKILMLMGAESNAFTGDDSTNYFVLGNSRNLEKIMEVESDRFKNLSYSEELLRTEATVILGEYEKGSSSPYTKLDETMRSLAFRSHSYGHMVIGYLVDVKAMPKRMQYSKEFYRRSYCPENCILLVIGDFDRAELVKLATRYYGDWAQKGKKINIPEEQPQREEKQAHIDWENETLPILNLSYRVPAFSAESKEIAALEILSEALFSQVSPLFKKLVLQDQSVESMWGGYEKHRDPFLFSIYVRVKKKADLSAVKGEIFKELEKAGNELISETKLREIQSKIRYSFAMALDKPLRVGFSLSGFLSLTGNPHTLNEYYATLEKVAPEEVRATAKRIFSGTNRTVVTLSHGEKK